jgi:hypothetical protein
MSAPGVPFLPPDISGALSRSGRKRDGLLRSNDQWIMLFEGANLHHLPFFTARHR